MVYKNKVYVCFDADQDMCYYRTLQMWDANNKIDFNFNDAHDLNQARDTSSEDTIKRKLKERLQNSNVLLVLIGESTKSLYRFVRWEIEQAQSLGLPIIAVNLNGETELDEERCPPLIRDNLAVHVQFSLEAIKYALEKWPSEFEKLKRTGENGAYFFEKLQLVN